MLPFVVVGIVGNEVKLSRVAFETIIFILLENAGEQRGQRIVLLVLNQSRGLARNPFVAQRPCALSVLPPIVCSLFVSVCTGARGQTLRRRKRAHTNTRARTHEHKHTSIEC